MRHQPPAGPLPTDRATPAEAQPAGFTTRHDTVAARAVGLWKVYGSGDTEVAALRGVTVEFHPGQFPAIVGPSGSGNRR